jgi:hypothetical protein
MLKYNISSSISGSSTIQGKGIAVNIPDAFLGGYRFESRQVYRLVLARDFLSGFWKHQTSPATNAVRGAPKWRGLHLPRLTGLLAWCLANQAQVQVYLHQELGNRLTAWTLLETFLLGNANSIRAST